VPDLTRWFIRTALVYLLVSLIAGVLQLTPGRWGAVLWPTYVHLLVLGWLTQLIFGVAYWLFPRSSVADSHGGDRLGWVSYWLLNTGLILRVIGEPARALGVRMDWLLLAAAFLQLTAGWAFVVNIWPRVKGR
jgi:heme/copper-type cytochrome/quinol oxidase subunit 1